MSKSSNQIDLWVIEHAVDFLASLPAEDTITSVSVNLSSHAFQSKALFPLIKQKLESTWVPASRLIFEITESIEDCLAIPATYLSVGRIELFGANPENTGTFWTGCMHDNEINRASGLW